MLQDYDLSIIVFHFPYLVDIEIEEIGRVLKLDSLKNDNIWKNNDIVIFKTWLLWYRSVRTQQYVLLQLLKCASFLLFNNFEITYFDINEKLIMDNNK